MEHFRYEESAVLEVERAIAVGLGLPDHPAGPVSVSRHDLRPAAEAALAAASMLRRPDPGGEPRR